VPNPNLTIRDFFHRSSTPNARASLSSAAVEVLRSAAALSVPTSCGAVTPQCVGEWV
jgi:hypothetical protein